jgi:TRAP transporter TAXI family solute receptor
MRKKLISVTCSIFLMFAMILAIAYESNAQSKPAKPSQLIISSGPSGGNWYAMGAAFSDVLTKAGVPTSSVPGGGTQNIVAISIGKADLGFAALASLDAAYKGQKPFDKPYKDVVMLVRLDTNPVYLIVHANSPIKDVKDIKGYKVAGPAPGTSSQMIITDLLEVYGIDETKDIKLRRGSMSEGAELFKDRNVDVYAITTGLTNASIIDISTSVPVRFLPLSDAVINKMKEKNPGYRKLVIPANHFRGQDKELPTVTADAALIVNKNMPEEYAYWVAKTVAEKFDTLAQACSWLKSVKREDMGLSDGIPIHPGAKKYFEGK